MDWAGSGATSRVRAQRSRLRATPVLAVGVAVLAVLTAYSLSRLDREARHFDEETSRDHLVLGHALAQAVSDVARTEGHPRAMELVEGENVRDERIAIHWVALEAPSRDLSSRELARLRASGAASRLSETTAGDRRLTTWVAVDRDDPTMGAIQMVEELAAQDEYVETSAVRAAMAALSAAGLAALLVYVFFRLWDAQNRAEREAEAREATLEQLRHAQRLGTIGKLASGVAHELGTPLNVIAGRAKMIARGESEGPLASKDAKIIGEQAERMTAIIRQLLDFARSGAPSRERVDVAALGRRTIALLEQMAEKRSVTLVLEGSDLEVYASGDPRQLEQVMSNLVLNAIQAQVEGGEVRVEVSNDDAGVRVAVSDRGPGVPEALRERIFEPFYTTKDVGEGTGLGLSVAWGIANDHGGRIEVSDRPGGGARFTLTLPGAEAMA